MSPVDPIIDLGFYGKLPTYGDFIQKRVPTDFVNPWHQWLQSGMLACRERDPEGWLSFYLNCPAWSFVLSAGICGEQAVAGVTIPSVDRVGRYFNFTLVSILPADICPATFAAKHSNWLAGLENLALSVLEQEMDQDSIEDSINNLSAELHLTPGIRTTFSGDTEHSRVLSDTPSDMLELLPEMLHKLISREHQKYGLWWHSGSSQVSAQLVTCASMPSAQTYLELMMNEDLIVTSEASSETTVVDYMDELLAD